MPAPLPALSLSDHDREQIGRWLSAQGTPQQVALRSRIVLAAAAAQSDSAIAHALAINRKTVMVWRARFAEQGLTSLWEIAPGRGRKPTYDGAKIKAIVDTTLQTKPKGMTHWSCRLMAARQGVSKSTVSNIWRSHNLKPHRVKRFKLSRDPHFLEKLTDVVGLYLNPPQQALVLCVDEKSQIQALDRTQPGLPLKKGPLRHDDARLQAQWHHHAVCRPGSLGRTGGGPVLRTASASGVLEVSAPAGSGVSWRGALALGDGQLRHAQTSHGRKPGSNGIRALSRTLSRPVPVG